MAGSISRPPVRLAGSDADIRAVAREAVAALHPAKNSSPDLFARLWELHRRRRQMVWASAHAAPALPATAAERQPSARAKSYRAVWGALLTVGLLSALVFAVQLDPPGRKNRFTDPELSISVALIAGVVAIAVLVVVLALPVPDPPSAHLGELTTVLTGMIVVWMLSYRLVVGVDDSRGFRAEDLAWWIPVALATALLLAGIVWRCDRKRRSEPDRRKVPRAGRSGLPKDVQRELQRIAERLASGTLPEEVRRDWNARLDTLEQRSVSAETLAQARAITPAAWLSWLCYDGETDVSSVLPGG